LLGFHSLALTLQGKFEFYKSLKVIRCCLGGPGKNGEAHPHLVVSLTEAFAIKLSCIPAAFLSRVFQLADEVSYLRLKE